MIREPENVLLGDPDDAASPLIFVHADARQPFAGHLGIVGAFVVVGIDDDGDAVAVLRQLIKRAGAAEGIIVGMRREQHDSLAVQVVEAVGVRRLGRGQHRNRGD